MSPAKGKAGADGGSGPPRADGAHGRAAGKDGAHGRAAGKARRRLRMARIMIGALAVTVACGALSFKTPGLATSSLHELAVTASHIHLGCATGKQAACPLTFLRYEPSIWEREWTPMAARLSEHQEELCTVFASQPARQAAWVNASARWLEGTTSYAELSAAGGDVLSAFVLRDECSGEERRAWIEPLVGHLRHPYALPRCSAKSPLVAIDSREYLVLSGLDRSVLHKAYPGRKLLFDLGTAGYETSLGWLTETYGALGVDFDEIWAWELQLQPAYWENVPPNIVKRLHFYNAPAKSHPSSPSDPLNILKSMAKPGDFVALKLDIDDSFLELSFIRRLEGDVELRGLVAELFFEMHYHHTDMAPWFSVFGAPPAKYYDVIALFSRLRSKGFGLHYWP